MTHPSVLLVGVPGSTIAKPSVYWWASIRSLSLAAEAVLSSDFFTPNTMSRSTFCAVVNAAGKGRRSAMPIRSASSKSTIHFMPSSMASASSFSTASAWGFGPTGRMSGIELAGHRHRAGAADERRRDPLIGQHRPCAGLASRFRSSASPGAPAATETSAASRGALQDSSASAAAPPRRNAAVRNGPRAAATHSFARLPSSRSTAACGSVYPIRLRLR